MDPVTAFVFVILFSLANGAVLGFMHRDLPATMRPAASIWRMGTLLISCGCMLLAGQMYMPLALVLPLANGLLTLGLTAYWQALRRFYEQPPLDWRWAWAPTVIPMVGIWWFAGPNPWLPGRIIMASGAWLFLLSGSILTLRKARLYSRAVSRQVLMTTLSVVAAVMTLRLLYYTLGMGKEQTIVDPGSVVNALTPLLAAVLPILGTTSFLLMISEQLRRQWEHAASTDHLTGLRNRRTLTDAGTTRFEQARAEKFGLAVALIDIDHFKSINDRFGHDVGDLALKHVAARINAACRGDDLPARQGGEEFVVVFSRVTQEQAISAAERLRESIQAETFVSGDVKLQITASIGIAPMVAGDARFEDLLRRADMGLYRAKHAGRNRVELDDGSSAPVMQAVS